MASVDPVVLGVGTVREVVPHEYINRETGTVEDRGRKVTLLTRGGFLVFNVPVAFNEVVFELGAQAVVWVKVRDWEFNGRKGTSLIFDSVAEGALVAAAAR